MTVKHLASLLAALIIGTCCVEAKDKRNQSLGQKLDDMVVSGIEFDNAQIDSVVSHLRTRSKAVDPDGKGVNFVLSIDKKRLKNYRVTLDLDDIPLSEVIRYVCMSCNLKYRILNHAVLIATPDKLPKEQMVTRTYRFHPENLPKTTKSTE